MPTEPSSEPKFSKGDVVCNAFVTMRVTEVEWSPPQQRYFYQLEQVDGGGYAGNVRENELELASDRRQRWEQEVRERLEAVRRELCCCGPSGVENPELCDNCETIFFAASQIFGEAEPVEGDRP